MADGTLEIDAFTNALRKFFTSKLGSAISQQELGLNFAVFPTTVPISEFINDNGTLNRPKAAEYFSRVIADRGAYSVDGTHFPNQASLSDTIRYQILGKAELYPRFDKTEEARKKDLKVFEEQLAVAKKRVDEALVSLGAIPSKYVPSEAVPANWFDPNADDLWSSYEQTLRNNNDDDAVPTHTIPPPLTLPWKVFDPDKIKAIINQLPPRGLFPPRLRPTLPPWADPKPLPDNWKDLLIQDFRRNLKAPGTPLNPGATTVKPVGGLGTFLRINAPAGAAGIASGHDQHSVLFNRLLNPQSKVDALAKLEDIEPKNVLDQGEADATNTFKSGILAEAVTNTPTETKDTVAVSFKYQVVEIQRNWLFWPFLQSTDWYISGAKRGDLTVGPEGQPAGVLKLIPERAIVIKDLSIKANFSDADTSAINDSFAIGPFRLDKDASIQAGVLTQPGVQIIAYLDRAAPVIPPRSDPAFVI
ncbi:hypothetical protein AFAE65S_03689 [Alcaligenes phenolicus]